MAGAPARPVQRRKQPFRASSAARVPVNRGRIANGSAVPGMAMPRPRIAGKVGIQGKETRRELLPSGRTREANRRFG